MSISVIIVLLELGDPLPHPRDQGLEEQGRELLGIFVEIHGAFAMDKFPERYQPPQCNPTDSVEEFFELLLDYIPSLVYEFGYCLRGNLINRSI